MNREIYVMYDSVSQNFGEPFTMANSADLRREFEETVKNPAVPVYAIRDVCVLHLGTFIPDSDNPVIIPATVPTVILRGGNYNVEEMRGQNSAGSSAAPELHSCEDC